jgi:hypothetical protein
MSSSNSETNVEMLYEDTLPPSLSETDFNRLLAELRKNYFDPLRVKQRIMPPSMVPPPIMTPSLPTVDCTKTKNTKDCMWESPSSTDRSNPMSGMICPKDASGRPLDMCWLDTKSRSGPPDPRKFKCGACNIARHSQTDSCHITMTASKNRDTTGWESNMTTNYSNACKNKWYKM